MPDINPVIGEVVSIDNVYIAPVTKDDITGFTAGTPAYFAPAGEIKYDPKVSTASSAFDGRIMFNYMTEGISETTLTLSGIAENIIAQVTGKSYDPTTGLVYDSGDLSRVPDYALGYRVEIGNGYYKYFWLLKGNFYLSASDAKTKGEKIDPVSQEIVFLPKYTFYQWSVPDPKNSGQSILMSQKRTIGDTSDPMFTAAANWFAAVVTPSAYTVPDALALLSSLPISNATAVPITAAPALTFNNAIADFGGITLIKADGTVVSDTVTLSTDGETVTITPTASLSAATVYTVIIADVKDVFGQKLATQTVKFTTA